MAAQCRDMTVVSAIWEAHAKWFNIGTQLRLKLNVLETIDHKPGLDIEKKFRKLISSWLKLGEQCTWRAIRSALNHHTVNLPDLAQKMNTNYGSDESQNSFVHCIHVFRLQCSLAMRDASAYNVLTC